MAQVLDLGDTFTEWNFSPSSEEADARAIASDWRVVGEDLWRAMESFEVISHGIRDSDERPGGR